MGDYAEDSDLPPEFGASHIFEDCIESKNGWRDISDEILPIVERACRVRIERSSGWRNKHCINTGRHATYLCPDIVIGVAKSGRSS